MAASDPNTSAIMLMPSPSVIPNFHGESRAGALIVTCITVTALMVVLVVLRLFSRVRYLKPLSYDDYFCTAAALGSIGYTVVTVLSTTAGFGKHLSNYPISTFTKSYYQKILAVQGLYGPVILIAKLSLFFLYFRIFSPIPSTRILLYMGMGINLVCYATSFSLVLYWCGNGSGSSLAESFTSHHCVVDARRLGIFQSSFNIFSDFYLLCIPIPIVSKLQLSAKRKIAVYAMFMSGSLAVICTILNLYYRILCGGSQDPTWHIPPVYTTSVVEVNICIMCGCFPALNPIFRNVWSALSNKKTPSKTWSNSSQYLKWLQFKNSGNKLNSSKAKITLGSRINGDGHFLTMKSMFGQEDEKTGSMDVSLHGHEPSMQTNIRSSYSQDPEQGSQVNGIRVKTKMTMV